MRTRMLSYKEFNESKQLPGTYAAVKLFPERAVIIYKLMVNLKVPNPEQADKFHVTLLYSRKHLPNYVPQPELHFLSVPTCLEVWPTKSGKNCLVLKLDSPALQARHKELMTMHEAEYDYPEYKTHISLSYDIGDYDIKKFPFDCNANAVDR